MDLTRHTYSLEGGKLNPTNKVEFVHDCLAQLAAIDEQIYLLDPAIHKDQIALLREKALLIQLSADKELSLIS